MDNMSVKIERIDDQEMVNGDQTTDDQPNQEPDDQLTSVLNQMVNSPSLLYLKKGIDWFNENANKKELFFQIKDFFHYFCLVTREAINDKRLNKLLPSLNKFFVLLTDVCYEWKCLSDEFEANFSFFNCIQLVLKQIIDKFSELGDITVTDFSAINETVPLMLSSMVVIVSTIHSIKEVVIISRPITTELILKFNGNSMSVQWKDLLGQITNVVNINNKINSIDRNDSQSLCQFVVRLIDLSISNNPFMVHISGRAIRWLCEDKDIPMEMFFIENQYQISRYILQILIMRPNFNDMEDIMHKTMHLFKINNLPKEFLRHIIPHFIVKCDQRTEPFLKEMSKIDCIEPSQLLKIYSTDIIRYLFFVEKPKTLEKALSLIENISKVTNFDIEYRIKVNTFDFVSLLMLWSQDYNATLELIAFVEHLKSAEDSRLQSKFHLDYFKENQKESQNVLKGYFLPFIHRYDTLMQDHSVCTSDKMTATKSFVQILDFMDNECIDLFRVKLLSTIKLIISEKFHLIRDLLKLSIEAMSVYVKKTNQTYICSQLSTICALLLPLMHFWPNEVSAILKDLIVNREEAFRSEFKHLYFIPEMPELAEVTEVIKPFLSYGENEEEICEKIRLVLENVNHENILIQIFALKELSTLLVRHQELVYKKCDNIKELDFDYFVTDIVNKLMNCLKSSDKNVISNASKCLGILGAIDPMKIDLEKPVISKEENNEKFLNFNDNHFKKILIKLLYKTITTADTIALQYCASFALQEVVKYFKSEIEKGRSDFDFDCLSPELKGMCQILKNTKYSRKLPINHVDPNVKFEPIFGSFQLTFNEWMEKWLTFLFQSFIFKYEEKEKSETENFISFSLSQPSVSGSSQLSDAFELQLAEALDSHSIKGKVLVDCYLLLTRNQSIADFLLPYIVITALKNANLEQRYKIVAEVRTVIRTLSESDEAVLNSEIGHLSSQTVFRIYDYLRIWHKNRILLHKRHCNTARRLRTAKLKDREFRGVEYFLNEETGISIKELSRLAYKCNANCRSLRYLEEYAKSSEELFQNEIPLFQEIFVRLEEPDSVEGCNSRRIKSPTITEQILTHEAMGQIQEALVCCAKALEANPNVLELQNKYLQISMDSFDQSEMVSTYGTGLITRKPEWRRHLTHHIIEATWRLGYWDHLDTLLRDNQDKYNPTFGSGLGELFNLLNKKSDSIHEFDEKINYWRTSLVGPLSAAAMEISGYVRGHKYIVDLHILHDIQLVYDKLINEELNNEVCSIENTSAKFKEIIEIFDQRNDLVRKATQFQEPILNSQRAMFLILAKRCQELFDPIRKQVFKSWLISTKTARKVGNIQRSYNCFLEMNKIRESLLSSPPEQYFLTDDDNCEAIIEAAKIKWARNKDNGSEAIRYLKSQIENHYGSILRYSLDTAIKSLEKTFSSEELTEIRNFLSYNQKNSGFDSIILVDDILPNEDNAKAFAKLQLLYAKYSDKSALFNQDTLSVLYRTVRAAAPKWEESHYNYALYCHKVLNNFDESKKNNKMFSLGKPEEILDMKGTIVKSLIESLKYGVKHAHNSLPLMFNIWFDLGTELYTINNKSRDITASQLADDIRKTIERINNSINDLVANTPLFIFFISFAQITARVLHPIPSITGVLKRIITKLIVQFPQQSMWLLLRHMKSYNNQRCNFFKEVLNSSMQQSKYLSRFIPEIIDFGKYMTNLCKYKSIDKKSQNLSLSKNFPEIAKIFRNKDFSKILLPFKILINVMLPKSFHKTDFNPFPSKEVYIRRIDETIEVFHSLQKPKKIKIQGTDGKTYILLCKNGDDLRKDNCLIEFCNLLNRCFKRDPETRRRQLRVKTYLVISLSDQCGLIEWIPGLLPFKAIVENQYKLKFNYSAIRDAAIKNWPHYGRFPNSEVIRVFEKEILPQFKPPVFSNWFNSTYTDPLSWYSARQAFTRSSAIFSIVGYLLGLGDRHGENILIEELTGESVHVDLNCMFNKGEDLAVPERVPFRLTQNMIDGMGITGYEGTFRNACQHVLRVARDNKEALLNFVRPFRSDHLFEWSKQFNSDSSYTRSERYEIPNDQAERVVYNIEARLNGIPSHNEKKLPKGISLSVEGQVDHVIKESTDINNLGLMYIGWTAYL